jgi:hypothetical protein
LAIPALSLLGFMDRDQAISYLQTRCLLHDAPIEELAATWEEARSRLGETAPNAGRPHMRDLPPEFQAHLSQVAGMPRFREVVRGSNWAFKLVEIDPLLSFQFHVESNRIDRLATLVRGPFDMESAVGLCLPAAPDAPPLQMERREKEVWIKGDRNLRVVGAELAWDPARGVNVLQLAFGAGTPWAVVVMVGGRCYLRNGYHRVCAIRRSGATHAPCLVLVANDPSAVGVEALGRGTTFSWDVLESDNPPTCAHFSPDRAYLTMLPSAVRTVHVSWSEFAFAAE